MKKILPQEVWFADFPFSDDETKSKKRPVIVLEVDEKVCKVLSMKITSRKPFSEFEIELNDWADIPLHHKSTADASDVKLVAKNDFLHRIGKLSNDDWDNVTNLYVDFLKSQGIIF